MMKDDEMESKQSPQHDGKRGRKKFLDHEIKTNVAAKKNKWMLALDRNWRRI